MKDKKISKIVKKKKSRVLKKKRTEKMVIKALEKSTGFIKYAAEDLKVSRMTLYNYINKKKRLQRVLFEIRENALDVAETMLMQNIKQGDHKAITYLLDNLGKSRGYGNKNQIGIANENKKQNFKVSIEFVKPKINNELDYIKSIGNNKDEVIDQEVIEDGEPK